MLCNSNDVLSFGNDASAISDVLSLGNDASAISDFVRMPSISSHDKEHHIFCQKICTDMTSHNLTPHCRLRFTQQPPSRWWDRMDGSQAIVCSVYDAPLRVGIVLVNENGDQLPWEPCINLKPLLVYHDSPNEEIPLVSWRDKNTKSTIMSEPLRKVSVWVKDNICFCETRPVASSDKLGKRQFQILYVSLLLLPLISSLSSYLLYESILT